MSLRKYMHPRNKYKQEPNFKQLAISYPEFRQIAITELSGKIRINFKDLETLRVLAKTLLKHDFDLDVEIPPTNLVPAVPLRLNYILWIEDLMKYMKVTDMSSVSGVDIGTGAVCVYPLLFAKMYGCKMFGTDIDSASIQSALTNITRNNMEHLIEVIQVQEGTVFDGALPEDGTYSFTMCNPPFFCTEENFGCKSNSSGNRLPPRNAPTGSNVELAVEGGEQKFVLKMIDDSIKIGDRVKIYTTMLGRKSSLVLLMPEIQKRNIENMTWTEFCQGHTKRWGLAWTFLTKDVIDLTKAPTIRMKGSEIKLKRNKERPPIEIIFPKREGMLDTDDLVAALKQWTNELEIQLEELDVNEPEFDCWACQLIAYKDTWSYARRKRRMANQLDFPAKRPHLQTTDWPGDDKQELRIDSNAKEDDKVDSTNPNTQLGKEPLIVCGLIVGETEISDDMDESKLKISMTFENGSGGRNALETFRQYLINKLDVRQFCQGQSMSKRERKKLKKDKKKQELT